MCRVRAQEPGRAGTVCPRVQGQGAGTSPGGTGVSPCAGSGHRNQAGLAQCVPVCRVRAREPVLEAQVCPRVQGQGAGTRPGWHSVSPCAGSGHGNQSWRHNVSPCAGSGHGNQSWRHRCVPVCRVRAREPVLEAQVCPRVQGQGAGTNPGGTGVSPCAGSGRRNPAGLAQCVPMCRVRAQEPGHAGTVCPRVQGQGAGTSLGGSGVSPCAGSGRRNQAGLAQCVPMCRLRAREPVLEAQCVPVCRIRAREPVLEAQVCPCVQGQGAGTSPGGTGVSLCAGSGRRNLAGLAQCVPMCRVRAREPGRAGTVCPRVQGQGAGSSLGGTGVSPCAGSGRRNQARLAQCVPVCRVRAQEPVLEAQVCPHVQGQGAGTSPGGTGVSPCAGSGRGNQAGLAQCVPMCRVRAQKPVLEAQVCPRVQGQGAGTSPGGTGVSPCQGQGAGTRPGWHNVSPCAGSERGNQARLAQTVPVCRVRVQELVQCMGVLCMEMKRADTEQAGGAGTLRVGAPERLSG
ncbi:uncharacterized protein LOC125754791 isoform X3 [Canis lupus dingo]|uniref:uncharacterized protein LOC125754791 isoform X3 n=1 Tax=Canis lupus dingo TaxID=286419 RepID=UPI0020C491B0|nr:uncharacterized protein LOC125754791 isoform X3 [Canis lupus dingo]